VVGLSSDVRSWAVRQHRTRPHARGGNRPRASNDLGSDQRVGCGMLCGAASVTATCGAFGHFAGTVCFLMLLAIVLDCDERDSRIASCYESCDRHATATCHSNPTAPKCVCDDGYFGDGIKCWPDSRPTPVDLNEEPHEIQASGMQWCEEAGKITVHIVGVLGVVTLASATPLVSCTADGCSGCFTGGAPLSRERAQMSWKVYSFSATVGAGCVALEYFRIAVPMFFGIVALLGFQLAFGLMCWSRLFQGRIGPELAAYPQQAAVLGATGTPPLTPPAPPGAYTEDISPGNDDVVQTVVLTDGSAYPALESPGTNSSSISPTEVASGHDGGSVMDDGDVLSSQQTESEATEGGGDDGEEILPPRLTVPAPPNPHREQPPQDSSFVRPRRRELVPASPSAMSGETESAVDGQSELEEGEREAERVTGETDAEGDVEMRSRLQEASSEIVLQHQLNQAQRELQYLRQENMYLRAVTTTPPPSADSSDDACAGDAEGISAEP
jgi:hypothetical protein